MKVIFSTGFKKDYKKLSEKIKNRFESRLALFLKDKKNRILNDHALMGKYGGYRSINITGDWRVIYWERGEEIIFVAIGTHSQLYG
jgi:addiction module RelE/StbE family toxin